MKYLYIIDGLGNGGQEKQLYLLLRHLKSAAVDCAVYVNHYNPNDKYVELIHQLSIPVLYTTAQSRFDKIKFVRSVIHQYKPVIAHSYSFHLNFFAWLCCLGTPCTAVGSLRSIPAYNIAARGLPKSLPDFILPQNVIANNHIGAKQLSKWLNRTGKKITVVENGIEITPEPHQREKQNIIKSISVGRVSAEKRIDLLIEVISQLINKGYSIQHEHWGTGVLLNQFQEQVNCMNLHEHFIFRGETSDIAQKLNNADLFIHTSDIEGMPNVIMEAMLQAKAVVTTNCGDVPYLINHQQDGWICEKGNSESLINACIYLLDNTDERINIGKAARKKIITKYADHIYYKKTMASYQQILNKGIGVQHNIITQ